MGNWKTEIEWLTGVYASRFDEPDEEYMRIYYAIMLSKGSILIAYRDNKPVGFFEVLRLTYEQLGRMVCELLNPSIEETTIGPVIYVKDDYTLPEYRGKGVIKELIRMGYKAHPDVKFIAWHRNRGRKDFVVYRRKKNG